MLLLLEPLDLRLKTSNVGTLLVYDSLKARPMGFEDCESNLRC
jgi:hypothetical protein